MHLAVATLRQALAPSCGCTMQWCMAKFPASGFRMEPFRAFGCSTSVVPALVQMTAVKTKRRSDRAGLFRPSWAACLPFSSFCCTTHLTTQVCLSG